MFKKLTVQQWAKGMMLHASYIHRAGIVIDHLTGGDIIEQANQLKERLAVLNGPDGLTQIMGAPGSSEDLEKQISEFEEVIVTLGLRK